MPRLDIPVSDELADAVKFSADQAGQSISEFVRRKIQVVSEPGPYTFSGLQGESLVRDLQLVAGWTEGSSAEADAARERIRRFERWSADVMFTPITTSSASQIVPPGYRDVMLTAGLDRPLFDACSQGTIPNAAPFSIPRAAGDGTVPATRAEAAQPAGADPTFGTTAVSPIGLSGLVDISRELADGASPGGDLIMLRLLREDWARRAEERIYAELNSTNGAGGTITTGFVPSGAMAVSEAAPTTALLSTLKKQLLRYSNVRRQQPRNTVAGAAAADNLGGLLGAEANTGDDNGMARILGSRLRVAVNDYGTASTDARILTLSDGDVWVFTSPMQSFRFDEQAGPALVRVAIWAYFAVAIVRAKGISSIRF